MIYIALLILCAVVFLICFLIDLLIKKLSPKIGPEGGSQIVRQPRRSAVLGVILLLAPLFVLLWMIPEEGDLLLSISCPITMLMGAVLLVSYFSVTIYYDEDGFVVKGIFRKKVHYRYGQIRGQRSLLTRSGVHSTLFVGEDTLQLTSAMQGVSTFLSKAFFRWCAIRGIRPDSVENNPHLLTFFPDPDSDGAQP